MVKTWWRIWSGKFCVVLRKVLRLTGILRDYTQNLRLDQYEAHNIDDEGEYEELDVAERRRLETQMDRRDRLLTRRMPAAFLNDDEELYSVADLKEVYNG